MILSRDRAKAVPSRRNLYKVLFLNEIYIFSWKGIKGAEPGAASSFPF
jgi:hypothetical protein